MPSVRVRRSHYSSLTDEPQTPRPLLDSLYIPPNQADNNPLAASPTSIGNVESHESQTTSPFATMRTGRRRAGSRVYNSLRLGEPPLLGERASRGNLEPTRPASADGPIIYEGSATNVQLVGDDHHSLIGSALDLPQPVEREGRPAVVRPQDGIHHHDDIVEHLEVIGAQTSRFFVTLRSSLCRS